MAPAIALARGAPLTDTRSGLSFGIPQGQLMSLLVTLVAKVGETPSGIVVEVSLDNENWVSLTGAAQNGETGGVTGLQVDDFLGKWLRVVFTGGVEKYTLMLN